MTRDNVMSTPIFDELLREMAQRAESRAPAPPPQDPAAATTEPTTRQPSRRRHRAD